ncbi:MAG TPA: DNRLRE domain-containing protein [Candidatus Saccharimonadales bacterium]|nr:DNRLRE domain-containing protein [Candidatus Saccharimonadales bacterium]
MKKVLILLPTLFLSIFFIASPAYAFTANLSKDNSGNLNWSATTSQNEINNAVAYYDSIAHILNKGEGYNQYGYNSSGVQNGTWQTCDDPNPAYGITQDYSWTPIFTFFNNGATSFKDPTGHSYTSHEIGSFTDINDTATQSGTLSSDFFFDQDGNPTSLMTVALHVQDSSGVCNIYIPDSESVMYSQGNFDGQTGALQADPATYTPITISSLTTTRTDFGLDQFITPPVTTASLSPTPRSDGSYTGPVTVTLSATPATGYTLFNSYYTIDGGSQQTYTSPFTITGDGSHTITYYSLDNNGAPETPNSETFTIADVTPTPTSTPTPTPSPTTLTPSKDSYIKHSSQNANEGAANILELSYQGKERAIIQFDQSQITAAVAGDPDFTATLQMTIASNNNKWGSSGRQIDVNRMEQSWTEGNGSVQENDSRGTGSGVTWDCSTDSNIANTSTNCSGSTAWNMIDSGSWPFASTPTATITIANGQSGTVSFDVTSDVQSFLNDTNTNDGWIIKKNNETQTGDVQFGSSNGSNSPKLIITPH